MAGERGSNQVDIQRVSTCIINVLTPFPVGQSAASNQVFSILHLVDFKLGNWRCHLLRGGKLKENELKGFGCWIKSLELVVLILINP